MRKYDLVIDPGHGGYDLGLRTGNVYNEGYGGILEKNINLEIANRISWLCGQHDISLCLTRYGERFIGLQERVKRINQAEPKVIISIHCNYARDKGIKGLETWHYYGSEMGRLYAEKTHSSLACLGYTKDRGVKSQKNNFYILRKTAVTSIVVELGFLSNKEDCLYLNNPNNQSVIACNLMTALLGIIKYQ